MSPGERRYNTPSIPTSRFPMFVMLIMVVVAGVFLLVAVGQPSSRGTFEVDAPLLPTTAVLIERSATWEHSLRPAAPDAEVAGGDTVTGNADGATLRYDDGSIIRAEPGAQVILETWPGLVSQSRGRVGYLIRRYRTIVRDRSPRGLEIAASGAQFTLDIRSDGTRSIEVTDGAARISANGKSALLTAGMALTLREGDTPPAGVDRVRANRLLLTMLAAFLLTAFLSGLILLHGPRGPRRPVISPSSREPRSVR